jgi:hypothetical protein
MKKVRNKILECAIWIMIFGGLLFWILDPILATTIFVFILYLIIKVCQESIRGFHSAKNLIEEGMDLKKLIPAYFFVGSIRGNYPNHNYFAVNAGSDPYVLFNKGEELYLYQCQKHLYPNGTEIDENNVPYWLIGEVRLKIPKQDIVAIELHRIIISERTLEKHRSNDFWKWYRMKSHPLLRYANLKDMQCNIVLTLVFNENCTNRYLSFSIIDKISNVVNFPWTEFAPEWYQHLDEFLEIVDEVFEYGESDSDVTKYAPALYKAKIMAAQIKEFAPHVKVRVMNY